MRTVVDEVSASCPGLPVDEERVPYRCLVLQPLLERLPLEDFLNLCWVDRRMKAAYKKTVADEAARRVRTEFPGFPALVLGQYATAANVDESLREACIRRLQCRTTISVGQSRALALLDDRSIMEFGDQRNLGVRIEGQYVSVSVDGGRDNRAALSDNGQVLAWETNVAPIAIPSAVPTGRGCVSVSLGYDHGLALLNNGEVIAWGSNSMGIGISAALFNCRFTKLRGNGAPSGALVSTRTRPLREPPTPSLNSHSLLLS